MPRQNSSTLQAAQDLTHPFRVVRVARPSAQRPSENPDGFYYIALLERFDGPRLRQRIDEEGSIPGSAPSQHDVAFVKIPVICAPIMHPIELSQNGQKGKACTSQCESPAGLATKPFGQALAWGVREDHSVPGATAEGDPERPAGAQTSPMHKREVPEPRLPRPRRMDGTVSEQLQHVRSLLTIAHAIDLTLPPGTQAGHHAVFAYLAPGSQLGNRSRQRRPPLRERLSRDP